MIDRFQRNIRILREHNHETKLIDDLRDIIFYTFH